jgi:septal ring-binding cell division protein DamX
MSSSEGNSEGESDADAPGNAVAIGQCRQCASEHVERVKKRGLEKLLGMIVPLHVYRCEYCFFRNLVFQSNKWLAGILILPIPLVALLLFAYLYNSNPNTGDQQVKASTSGKKSDETNYYYDIDFRNRGTRQTGNAQTINIESNIAVSSQYPSNTVKMAPNTSHDPAFVNDSEKAPFNTLAGGGDQQSARAAATMPRQTASDPETAASLSVSASTFAARKNAEPPAIVASAADADSKPPPVSPKRVARMNRNGSDSKEKGAKRLADNDQSSRLFALDSDKYTIQISSKRTQTEVFDFMRRLSKEMPGPFFYYRSTKQRIDWYPVLCGTYGSRELAEAAIAELPADVRGNNPFVRSIGTVQKRARGR